MNHRKGFKKLGKKTAHRNAILNNLLSSLIKEERITTTKVKAKEVQKIIEKAFTRAKNTPYKEYQDNFSKRVELVKRMKEQKANAQKINLNEEEQKLIDNAACVLHNYKILSRRIREKDLVKKLIQDIGFRIKERNGGYTRVLLLGQRRGDASEMAILEIVDKKKIEDKETKSA